MGVRLRDISGLVDGRMAKGGMAACGVAVVHGGEGKAYACGDASRGAVASTSTRFHICSCSKAFTAAAFAKLVERGAAQWDMPVHHILPEFVLPDPDMTQRCTMRDLAGMRLGLSRDGIAEWGFRPDAPVLTRLARARDMAQIARFRERFCYSNIGYIALAVATARIAGMDYAQCLQELVLSPRGLDRAALEPAIEDAQPHLPVGKDMICVPELTGENSQGSARVHLSADDAASWLAYMLRAARGNEGSALQECFLPQIAVSPVADATSGLPVASAYGFGWHVSQFRGRRLFNHGGGGRGWRASALLDPDRDVGVMVFASHEGVGVEALALALLDLQCGERPEDWESVLHARAESDAKTRNADMDLRCKTQEGGAEVIGVLEGLYANPVTGKVRIGAGSEGFHFAAEDAPAFDAQLSPIESGVFEFQFENPAMRAMPNDPLFQMRFLRATDGSIAAETTYFGNLEKIA